MGTSMIATARVVLVAAVTPAVVTATPSVAARVVNADKVDGKHAVGAKARPSQRAGKLVATDRAGRLPDDIIAKASDADQLDGLDSTAYRGKVAAPGELMAGVFGIVGFDYQDEGAVTFPSALSAELPASRTTVVPPGGSTAECPAVGQVAVNGWLCVYETQNLHVTGIAVLDPRTTTVGVNRLGFLLNPLCSGGTCIADGIWAVRAP